MFKDNLRHFIVYVKKYPDRCDFFARLKEYGEDAAKKFYTGLYIKYRKEIHDDLGIDFDDKTKDLLSLDLLSLDLLSQDLTINQLVNVLRFWCMKKYSLFEWEKLSPEQFLTLRFISEQKAKIHCFIESKGEMINVYRKLGEQPF
jgi:hypothetical protein